MYTATVDLGEFRQAAAAIRNDIVRACYESSKTAAQAGRDHAKSVGPFQDRTGQLRATIRAEHSELDARGGAWDIVAPKPYALFVEGGTRPHEIRARDPWTKPLQFYWAAQGRWFVGARVDHPGTRPYPFMGPAYDKAHAALVANLEANLARIASSWS